MCVQCVYLTEYLYNWKMFNLKDSWKTHIQLATLSRQLPQSENKNYFKINKILETYDMSIKPILILKSLKY